jgi:hypothetical protein
MELHLIHLDEKIKNFIGPNHTNITLHLCQQKEVPMIFEHQEFPKKVLFQRFLMPKS